MRQAGMSTHPPTLVLLHGWGFSAAVWEPVRVALPAGIAVHAPDLPGHGRAGRGERLHDAEAVAARLIDELPARVKHPVWVGWSLGGLVALAASRLWSGPQRLVLVGSTPRFCASADWPHGLPAAELADFRAALAGPRPRLERRLAMLCARGSGDAASLARDLAARLRANPASAAGLEAGLELLEGGDRRADWHETDAAVAAWLGEADALVPAAVVDDLQASRPDARIERVAGSHADWVRRPAPLAGFLREIVEQEGQ